MTGSLTAYAKHRKEAGLTGGSLASVQKARDTRRIVLEADGSVAFERADSDWEQNTSKRQQRGTRSAPSPTTNSAEVVSGLSAPEANDGTYLEAQRQHEWERVLKERLARKIRERELYERSMVIDEVGGLIVAAKNRLRSVGSKAGPAVAMESEAAVCQALIDAEVDEALAELAKWKPAA